METKSHYNYRRDYNPRTGRYIQSDPIGLDGGLNTFGYVGGNPLVGFDSRGLKAIRGGDNSANQLIIPLLNRLRNGGGVAFDLLRTVQNSVPEDIRIYGDSSNFPSWLISGAAVTLDPNHPSNPNIGQNVWSIYMPSTVSGNIINTQNNSCVPDTVLRTLVHELGHVALSHRDGTNIPNNFEQITVNTWEDPVMLQLDRTTSGIYPGTSCTAGSTSDTDASLLNAAASLLGL